MGYKERKEMMLEAMNILDSIDGSIAKLKKRKIMTDDEIEQYIIDNDLNAPRLTPEDIQEQIQEVQYYHFPNTNIVVCAITVENGYTVLGDSSCVSSANFDESLGKEIARKNAIDEIWGIEGYRLKQYLYEKKNDIL